MRTSYTYTDFTRQSNIGTTLTAINGTFRSILDHVRLVNAATSAHTILAGYGVTAGTFPQVLIEAGYFIATDGTLYTDDASTQNVTATANAVTYLSFDVNGVYTVGSVLAGGNLPIAKITVNGTASGFVSIEDLRPIVSNTLGSQTRSINSVSLPSLKLVNRDVTGSILEGWSGTSKVFSVAVGIPTLATDVIVKSYLDSRIPAPTAGDTGKQLRSTGENASAWTTAPAASATIQGELTSSDYQRFGQASTDSAVSKTLLDNQAAPVLITELTTALATANLFAYRLIMKRGPKAFIGELMIAADATAGCEVSYMGADLSGIGVNFTAAIVSGNVEVSYTTDSQAQAVTAKFLPCKYLL